MWHHVTCALIGMSHKLPASNGCNRVWAGIPKVRVKPVMWFWKVSEHYKWRAPGVRPLVITLRAHVRSRVKQSVLSVCPSVVRLSVQWKFFWNCMIYRLKWFLNPTNLAIQNKTSICLPDSDQSVSVLCSSSFCQTVEPAILIRSASKIMGLYQRREDMTSYLDKITWLVIIPSILERI